MSVRGQRRPDNGRPRQPGNVSPPNTKRYRLGKAGLVLLLFCLAAGAAAAPAPGPAPATAPPDVLVFLNGDVLHGQFLSLDARTGARWQYPAVRSALTVNPGGLAKIRLQRPRPAKPQSGTAWGVRLANEDELIGDLVALDEEQLSLATWFAGTLRIPRKMLQSLTPGLGRRGVVYEGPTGLEGWTMRNTGGFFIAPGNVIIGGAVGIGGLRPGGWTYSNEVFSSIGPGSLGRDVKLPPVSNFEFDLAWRGYLSLALFVYTDTLEGYGGNAYMLQLNYRSATLHRRTQAGSLTTLGTAETAVLGQKTKTHVSIRTHKEQKILALYLDGVPVKQWNDPNDFVGAGTGILFWQQGQAPIQLSNIRVSEWDGRLEEGPAVVAEARQEDYVTLANKDKVVGTVKAIKEGKLVFATSFATLEIPLDRVTQVEFAREKAGRAAPGPMEVRAVFFDRGSVTFRPERWDDQHIVGVSANFGQVKFVPGAFSLIQFNLDRPKAELEPGDWDGLPGVTPE